MRAAPRPRRRDALGDGGEVGMLERRRGVVERQPVVEVQIVRALGERLDQQARAVEEWISGHDMSVGGIQSDVRAALRSHR